MSIKTIKANITELQARIWRNRQYLAHTHKQLVAIYRATPATAHRSRQQLRALQTAIDRDNRQLEAANRALVAAIDCQPSAQIKEILTRRYLSDEPFADIYDVAVIIAGLQQPVLEEVVKQEVSLITSV